MILRFVVSISLLWASIGTAQARAKAPMVRLGIAIDAPKSQTAAIEHLILPGTAPQMQLIGGRRYMAMADRLALLWPYTPKSARQVGRALHLTHVAIFEVAQNNSESQTPSQLRVRLVDVRTGRVPVHKRYSLPDGRLSEATAERIVEALRYMLLGERPGTRQREAEESPLAQLGRKKEPAQTSPDDGQDASAPASSQAALQPDSDAGDQDARIARALRLEGRKQAHLGLSFALRKAQLSPPNAPCYCDNGSFAPGILGLRLQTALFFDPNKTHFGVHLEAGLGIATLPVDDGVFADESQSIPWSVQGDVAYRLFEEAVVSVSPHLGAAHARFPISRGPFVGTAYTTVFAGLDVETLPFGGVFVLRASGDFSVVAHSGLEAAQLGAFQNGVGWQVQLGPALRIGPFRLGASCRYAVVDTHYTGPTALYAATRYNDVSLKDATFDAQVQFGATLW